MERFEYKVIRCDSDDCLEKTINNIARDGWRFKCMVYRAYFHAYYILTFERLIKID